MISSSRGVRGGEQVDVGVQEAQVSGCNPGGSHEYAAASTGAACVEVVSRLVMKRFSLVTPDEDALDSASVFSSCTRRRGVLNIDWQCLRCERSAAWRKRVLATNVPILTRPVGSGTRMQAGAARYS
jgi:hypothetical protein